MSELMHCMLSSSLVRRGINLMAVQMGKLLTMEHLITMVYWMGIL